MMGLAIALLLGFAALTAVLIIARRGASLALLAGAALMLGLAGYAWQGRPGLKGAPVADARQPEPFDEEMAQQRRALADRLGPAGRWLILSDGLGRAGNTEGAVNVLVSAVRERPDDPALWVGLANALVSHGGGRLSPAADFAFKRALTLDERGYAARYFYGLALAESGQLDRARVMWLELLGRLPADAGLRRDLARKLAIVDMLIKRQNAPEDASTEP